MQEPARPASRHLDARQLGALEAIGDVLIPGDDDLPSFSRLGCASHVDRLLDSLPLDDLRGLRGVLALASIVPRFAPAGLLRCLESGLWLPGPWAASLRVAELGVRRVGLSLYYSGRAGSSYDGPMPLDFLSYRVGAAVEECGREALEAAIESSMPVE
jgi:hypothetical protein